MGRHAREDSASTGVAGYLWGIVIIVVVVIIAVFLYFFFNPTSSESSYNSDASSTDSCIEGEASVPFAQLQTDKTASTELIQQFEATHPVVQDHCITFTETSDLTHAAIVFATGAQDTITATLKASGALASTEHWPLIDSSPIGIALKADSTPQVTQWADVDPELSVAYPQQPDPLISVVIAKALAHGDTSLAESTLRAGAVDTQATAISNGATAIATLKSSVPDEYTFFSPEALALPTYLIPLSTSSTVTEIQSRAAGAFASFASESVADRALGTTGTDAGSYLLEGIDQLVSTFAQLGTSTTNAEQPLGMSSDTLILFDTSSAMNSAIPDDPAQSWFSASVNALIPLVSSGIDAGSHIALWNYSSPLNPGVVKGWRDNIDYTDSAATISDQLRMYGTGGVPYTRSSVLAALDNAHNRASITTQPVRVIVITSGTADNSGATDDSSFASALSAFDDSSVQLNVITVQIAGGSDPTDSVLTDAASHTGGVVRTVQNTSELASALTTAFGQ